MGQMLVIAEGVDELPRRPNHMPKCPKTCLYNGAPWSNSFTEKKWGGSGFELPASG